MITILTILVVAIPLFPGGNSELGLKSPFADKTSDFTYDDINILEKNGISATCSANATCHESHCPPGSFIMQIGVTTHYMFFFGYCYHPGSSTRAGIVNSYPAADMRPVTNELSCSVGPILNFPVGSGSCHVGLGEYMYCCGKYMVGIDCQSSQSLCPRNQAISGFKWTCTNSLPTPRDNHIICSDVGHPADLCDPRDLLELIIVCDMREALAPSQCRYSQTIGFGNSTSMSQSERRELQFYSEMSFDVGGSGFGLSANFGGKLGHSETTGFDWSKATGQTWNVETTIEVTMEIPPGIKTELYQAVGRCTFYSVSTNFYKRVDSTKNGNIIFQQTFFA